MNEYMSVEQSRHVWESVCVYAYVCVCVCSAFVSSFSQRAHIAYFDLVHKSDFCKNEACKMQLVFGGCLKWKAIALHIART